VTTAALPDARAAVAEIRTAAALIFPIRHHSPASALQLLAWLKTHRPAEVLIEAPADFQSLLPWLTAAAAVPPLAIYAWAVDAAGRRRAAYFPFAECSPEWVALRVASARGVPVHFVDAPFAARDSAADPPEQPASALLQDERWLARSAGLQALAEACSCRDAEDLWEHLFEIPGPTLPLADYLTRMLAYCEQARQDSDPQALEHDGTSLREAWMAEALAAAIARRSPGDGPVLLVLGGFHALAVARHPPVAAPPHPRGNREHGAALIPYTDARLERLNGYAAGMCAPGWQRLLFRAQQTLANLSVQQVRVLRAAQALALLGELAGTLRASQPVSLPQLQAAHEQALRLAALRGRGAIARMDLRDAALALGSGDSDGEALQATLDRLLTGRALGRVPTGAPTTPLLQDFLRRAGQARLRLDGGEPRETRLQLEARAAHRQTAQLLHGLAFLGIPFAVPLSRTPVSEHWQYQYTPTTAAALVEASVHGASLAEAVQQVFGERLAAARRGPEARSAVAMTRWFREALRLGLHAVLPELTDALRAACAADAHFPALVEALSALVGLRPSAVPAALASALPRLKGEAGRRALYLAALADAAAPEEWSAALLALPTLAEASVAALAGAELDALLARLAAIHPAALVRGTALGLCWQRQGCSLATLQQALHGHLGGGLAPVAAVDFLRGLLGAARELAWQQPALIAQIDAQLDAWDEDTFVRHLPELRLAFAELTPRETDRVAAAVLRHLDGPAPAAALLPPASAAADRAARAQLEADGLAHWWSA
jgi:hypothetical protein